MREQSIEYFMRLLGFDKENNLDDISLRNPNYKEVMKGLLRAKTKNLDCNIE